MNNRLIFNEIKLTIKYQINNNKIPKKTRYTGVS